VVGGRNVVVIDGGNFTEESKKEESLSREIVS